MKISVSDFCVFFLDGEGVGAVVESGVAGGGEGALAAVGVGRHALDGAHLHHGLVEGAGVLGGHPLFADGLHFFAGGGGGDIVEKAFVASGKAEHVSVHGGVGEVEGEGGDGGGGVVAHPFQPADAVVVGREGAAVVADDGLGGGVHIAGAAVVAESLPHLQDL